MTAPWLTVIGIGEEGVQGICHAACVALYDATLVIGGRRHLEFVDWQGCPTMNWRSPLTDTLDDIAARAGTPTVVLASGDPSWHGIAKLLITRFGAAHVRVLPHIPAYSLACARLGWAIEDATCISLHGRPLVSLRRWLQPGRRILGLTGDATAPTAIARLLAEAGFSASDLTVLERLGGPAERIAGAGDGPHADLHVVAIVVRADAGKPVYSQMAGLPDDAFEHDGQLTKREVRATTLAQLGPLPGQLLWDVGAGAGSIAIEWLRTGTDMRAIAIERDPGRAERISRNAATLGVPELAVVTGEAPDCLDSLASPDAVFIGGDVGNEPLFERCWSILPAGGRLVANSVTLDGEANQLRWLERRPGSLTRIAITRSERLGRSAVWRPLMPVTQLVAVKP